MNVERTTMVAVAFTLLYGCALVQPEGEGALSAGSQHKGEQNLAAGIRNYEDGKYYQAMKTLEASLDLGLSEADQVRAHKYLAFIHCASERAAKCRSHFLMALTIDPGLELEPAEAGHPIWGPAFRSVKSPR